jgi:hypothetical protein
MEPDFGNTNLNGDWPNDLIRPSSTLQDSLHESPDKFGWWAHKGSIAEACQKDVTDISCTAVGFKVLQNQKQWVARAVTHIIPWNVPIVNRPTDLTIHHA